MTRTESSTSDDAASPEAADRSQRPSDDPDRAKRASRRAAAKQFHPDRGGSADAFIAALESVEATATGAAPLDVHPTGKIGRARRGLRRAARAMRTRLPRAVPGSVRYHSI